MHRITVATNCYEKDIYYLLERKGIKRALEAFNYTFYERLLIINTKEKDKEVVKLAQECVREKIIDSYFFVCEYRDEIVNYFKIDSFKKTIKLRISLNEGLQKSLKNIYHFYFPKIGKSKLSSPLKRVYDAEGYSIGPLAAIYFAKGDFLLYFTEDCIQSEGDDWIDPAVRLLTANPQFLCARPFNDCLDLDWYKNWEIKDGFYIRFVFTDQMFLAPVQNLVSVDYNYPYENTLYPAYGANGFESKIFNYMQKSKQTILVSKNCKYIHDYADYRKYKK